MSSPSGEAAGGKEPCPSSKPADNAASSIHGEFKRQEGVAVSKKRSQVLANCVKVTECLAPGWRTCRDKAERITEGYESHLKRKEQKLML